MSLVYHIDKTLLEPSFLYKLDTMEALLDIELLVYCGVRTVEQQNILFRRSSTKAKVAAKVAHFEELGRTDLAKALSDTPSQPTAKRPITRASGGESWHNYRLAVDCVPMVHGKALWSVNSYKREWHTYGKSAEKAGLSWSGNWKGFKEYAHTQDAHGTPLQFDMEPLWTL